MIDIKLIRENPELVKENIKKKFQDEKLPMVDEVAEFDKEVRAVKAKGDALRADRNKMSKEIGLLMRDGKKEEAEQVKAKVKEMGDEMETLEMREAELNEEIKKRMYVIPNIIDSFIDRNATFDKLTGKYNINELADFDDYLRKYPFNKSNDIEKWLHKVMKKLNS